MGFKFADYQRGIRESRALFTGGSESVLKGGPQTPRDIIERFFVANKARFEVQQEMYKNIQAAKKREKDRSVCSNWPGSRIISIPCPSKAGRI